MKVDDQRRREPKTLKEVGWPRPGGQEGKKKALKIGHEEPLCGSMP